MSDGWTALDLRRALLDKASAGDVGAPPEALSAPTRRTLGAIVDFIDHYDGSDPELPEDVTESVMYRWMMTRLESQVAFDSVKRGNANQMRAIAGSRDNATDATGYERLVKACKPAAHQILIKGAKGSGKTTKALDIARNLHADGVIDKILTNIEGPADELEFVQFGETMSAFLEFAKQPGEKLVIGDEFSTVANEWTGGADVKAQFGRCINALRKGEGGSTRLMIIGHEHDTDVSKVLRTQSDVVIRAEGKVDEGLIDRASVYAGWKDYLADDIWFRVRGMLDVPSDSPWSADTNYFAHFEFDLDSPEEQIVRGKLRADWRDYQESAQEAESESTGPKKCRGMKDNGERCGSLVWDWDGDGEPLCPHHSAE